MSTSVGEPIAERPGGGSSPDGWGSALARAAVVVVLSIIGFVLVPNRLVAYLSLHAVPRTRDALLLIWMAVVFAFMSWLFVRLQVRRGS